MWMDEYMQILLSDNVNKNDWENALELKYQNIPSSLYKYRSCSEYAIENLLQDEMWFNSAAQMNDPYDSALTLNQEDYIDAPYKKNLIYKLLPRYLKGSDIKINPSELKELETKSFDDIWRYIAKLSPKRDVDQEEVNELVNKFKKLLKGTFDEKVQQAVETMQKTTFISCFSEKNDSMLMWSHYTNNHQGFCIEYNFTKPEVDTTITQRLLPVVYSEKLFDVSEYLKRSSDGIASNTLFILCAAISKSLEWEYEKEWRIAYSLMEREKGFNRKFFTPEAIYLGAKMSTENKEQLLEIAKIKQISVYQMKMKKDKFKLVAEKIL